MQIQKYFILLNILATLSQHLPRQQDQQIATIIVSATSTQPTARTDVSVAVAPAEAEAEARTTSASAFVDEVLPHNDNVATTTAITKTTNATNATILHAKAIDSNNNNNNTNINGSDLACNNKYNNNNNDSENENENESDEELTQLIERKLQEEQKTALASASLTVDGTDALAAVPSPVHLLSRKRRYLIFPEGSSFQLVYDGIYGIVDYTNYLILGITVALAWELPSKPQGEVIEEIATRLRDPTNDLRRNDTASQIIYVDTKKKSNPINGKQPTQQPIKSLRPNYINLMTYTNPAIRKSDYKSYYTNAAGRLPATFHAPMHQKYYYIPKGSNKYDYNNYVKYHILQQQRPKDSYYRKQHLPSQPVGGNYRERPNDWRRKDNNYYVQSKKKTNYNNKLSTLKVNPFNKWRPQQRKSGIYSYMPQAQAGSGQYPWWNLASRLSNSLRRKPIPPRRIDTVSSGKSQPKQQQQQQQQQQPKQKQPTRQQQAASGFYQHSTGTARKHRIYPVFGKRSIADEPRMAPDLATAAAASNASAYIKASNNNNHTKTKQQESTTHHRRYRRRRSGIIGTELSRMERIHVRHHRSTRQTLYGKIEKYLDKLGIKNSHHCLLRALCETGQKSNEVRPGTFVGELMRAVFTMPEPLDDDLLERRVHYKDQRYDLANAFEGTCAQEYGLCQESLWKSQFVQ